MSDLHARLQTLLNRACMQANIDTIAEYPSEITSDAMEAISAALREVVADAARYRWMRNFGREEDWQHWWELDPPEKLDAAIDSARSTK